MSIQAGICTFDGKPVTRVALSTISERSGEQNRDGETSYLDGVVGMLYRPFHTTMESRLERQPHVTGSGKIVTWDGRLDNREELMRDLSGALTEDRTDVAIVAAALDKWGTNAFAKIVGDWALAMWDPPRQRLVLARDYIGVNKLFYYLQDIKITWCTQLLPLASCGDQFTLSDEYIAGYFGLFPDAHLTPYREIRSTPPGGFVVIENGKARVHSYWSFDPDRKIRYNTDGEYEEHFRELFRQAVRRRLRTDSPILADLSGGCDSSSIVCMADDILGKEGCTRSLDTFSFFDPDEPDEEDPLYFPKVEERRGRVGHHAPLHGVGDTWSFDYRTFVPTPGLGARQELKAAYAEVISCGQYRVLLSGMWGDEFVGYALDPPIQMADLLAELRIKALWTGLRDWSEMAQRPWIHVLGRSLFVLLPTSVRTRIKRMSDLQPWLNENFGKKHKVTQRLLVAAEGPWSWSVTDRFWYQTYLRATRRLSDVQPSSAELRYPYLDQHLTEFLTSVPTDQLTRPGNRRSLVRRALADLIPPEILSRRTKSGTGRCISLTLDKHWDRFESSIRSPVAVQLGYLNAGRFYDALSAARRGKLPHLHALVLLKSLSLELWLRDMYKRGVLSLPNSLFSELREDAIEVNGPRVPSAKLRKTISASRGAKSRRKEVNNHGL
jgi:asparagine synthase (glutamine-hydrolysing)